MDEGMRIRVLLRVETAYDPWFAFYSLKPDRSQDWSNE
jgi:hypothetical protein